MPAIIGAVLSLSGCGAGSSGPRGPILIEKGVYQLLYTPDGKVDRLLFDENGDMRADTILLYDANDRLMASERDTNLDGVVDQWEYFDSSDRLGTPRRREFDDDGDGQVDRIEVLSAGQVIAEELDTDRSGKADRRIVRGPDGRIAKIETDRDEDGDWDTSIAVSSP